MYFISVASEEGYKMMRGERITVKSSRISFPNHDIYSGKWIRSEKASGSQNLLTEAKGKMGVPLTHTVRRRGKRKERCAKLQSTGTSLLARSWVDSTFRETQEEFRDQQSVVHAVSGLGG
jgi:hypothetical protein